MQNKASFTNSENITHPMRQGCQRSASKSISNIESSNISPNVNMRTSVEIINSQASFGAGYQKQHILVQNQCDLNNNFNMNSFNSDNHKNFVNPHIPTIIPSMDLAFKFYDCYFLVKPVTDMSSDQMHFQFEAKIHDEEIIKILKPCSKGKSTEATDFVKRQSQSDTQRTLASGPNSNTADIDQEAIKIPKALITDQLIKVSDIILQ